MVSDDSASSKTTDDIAVVVGATENADALAVLRKRGDSVNAAVLKKAAEGQPVQGDLVRLKPREEPLAFDVETIYEAPKTNRSGPAKVSSDRYRKGWDRLFRKKTPRSLPN